MGVLVDKKPGDDPAVQSLEWERFTPEDTAEIIAEPPVTSLDREHFALEIVEGDFDGGVEIAIGEEGSGLRAVHRYRKTGGAHTLWTSPIGFRVEGGVPVPRFKSTSSALVTYHTEEDGLSVRSFDGASCMVLPDSADPQGESLKCVESPFLGAAEFVSLRVGDFDGDDDIDMAYVVDDPIMGRQSYVFMHSAMREIAPEASVFLWLVYDGLLADGVELDGHTVGRLRALGRAMMAEGQEVRGVMGLFKFAMEGPVKVPELRLEYVELVLDIFERSGGDIDLFSHIAVKDDGNPVNNWPYMELVSDLVGRLDGKEGDGQKRFYLINMLSGLFWGKTSPEGSDHFARTDDFLPLVRSLASMGERLDMEQLAAVRAAMWFGTIRPGRIKHLTPEGLAARIDAALEKGTGAERYDELFSLFKGELDVDGDFLVKYAPFMHAHNLPTIEDLRLADEAIGHEDALLLYRKFNITRFTRYHPTMLRHLVRMAKDDGHMRDKPLVMIITAQYDDTGMFHWGRRFEHDPRVRVVAAEVSSVYEFEMALADLTGKYGAPDSVLITAHGQYNAMLLGSILIDPLRDEGTGFLMEDRDSLKGGLRGLGSPADYEDQIGDMGDVFGGAHPQIVLNSCSTGKQPPEGELNVAQMLANIFQTEVRAPEAVEGLLDLDVLIDGWGRARLSPLYAEVRGGPIGINEGGRIFVPQPKGVITPRDYGGFGSGRRDRDRNRDANPINADLPDVRDGLRRLFGD